MASEEVNNNINEPCAESKTDPPVLSQFSGAIENEQDLEENCAAPLLSPVEAIKEGGESLGDKHSGEDEDKKETSVTSLKRKKQQSQAEHSEDDADGCGSSSCSVTRRTRHSDKNAVLITLSSDSDSIGGAKEKMSHSDEEPATSTPVTTEVISKKRVAHVNAELIRKFSVFGWSSRKDGGGDEKMSDYSSDNSEDGKAKKTARRKKQKNLASRAALAKKKYFRSNTLRRRCVKAAKNTILSGGKPTGKVVSLRSRKTALPKLKERQPINARGRGRPKKITSSPSSSQCGNRESYENAEGTDDEASMNNSDQTSSKTSNVSAEYEVKSNSDKTSNGENNNTVILRRRGRPKLSDKERQSRLSDKERQLRLKKKKDFYRRKGSIIDKKIKPILQNESCFELASIKLPKCRECLLAAKQKNRKNQQSYCRFFEYRKLCFAKNGNILNAGFSQASDSTIEDMRLWLPTPDNPPTDLTKETSKALLVQVGDQFCDLIEQEKNAVKMHIGADRMLTWKRIVQGVREMCDVCDTTLFNIHWVCPKCGLAVCIDCYKVRMQGIVAENEEGTMRGVDEYMWLLCNGRQPHLQDQLIMAQIVPGNALWLMGEAMHSARDRWKIAAYCGCRPHEVMNKSKKNVPTGICKELMCHVSKAFSTFPNISDPIRQTNGVELMNCGKTDIEINDSGMKWLANINDCDNQIGDCDPCYESFTSLKNIFIQGGLSEESQTIAPLKYSSFTLDDIILSVEEAKADKIKGMTEKDAFKLFNHRYPQPNSGRDPLPIRIFTTTESSMIYPDVPHSWLCNGRLLLLHQTDHTKNLELFQEQWKRGQPIMVMGVDQRLDMTLWTPEGFCRDFGEVKNDLVNCRTGTIIPNLPMKKFWEGFENFEKRMKDESGEYMLLKLKDWPPGEDFSEKLPTRFQDLMKGLPLPEYTHRDGIFNLAGRLPHWFVRPDLGPKMYNAYGSALYPTKGTTNLHLDVSDAVNVMVYVGVPHDGKDEDHIQEALKAIDDGGCDSLMRERVRSRGVRPGALWHIYNARDADKIRDMLTKVAIERGEKLEAQHDPIHDQSWYIDTVLRKRLYHEYGVEGYAIAQCLGDAVFIPAGAPHQVRNLHSCVKVAEDFVSPENIGHCFKLTQEFRHLSDTHTNHEDKLQIKNIIYHVVKDALSHLIEPEIAMQHDIGIP